MCKALLGEIMMVIASIFFFFFPEFYTSNQTHYHCPGIGTHHLSLTALVPSSPPYLILTPLTECLV